MKKVVEWTVDPACVDKARAIPVAERNAGNCPESFGITGSHPEFDAAAVYRGSTFFCADGKDALEGDTTLPSWSALGDWDKWSEFPVGKYYTRPLSPSALKPRPRTNPKGTPRGEKGKPKRPMTIMLGWRSAV